MLLFYDSGVANNNENQAPFLLKKESTLRAADPVASKASTVATTNMGGASSNTNGAGSIDESLADGLIEVENESILRFPEDDRVHEVCRLLRSSLPCYLKVERSPESSETDFRLKQQTKLMTLCRRTLACTVGRGMLTIATMEPLMAEALPIPTLSLHGRVPPTNSIVALDTSAAHDDLKLWPEFHNGVAAALRVGPAERFHQHHVGVTAKGGSHMSGRKRVTRNWIIYNKTAAQNKVGGDNSHAGFLLGMGLFGHLSVLTITDICDYLTLGHEPSTIAVLIGVAASKMSTADALLSKTLCLHLPTLLPAQHWDIEISPLIQCAALVGLGFLYCRSGHRLIVQFLLAELSRKPTSDRCECRESLSLSAAWSLAMVLLPKKLFPPPVKPASFRRENIGSIQNHPPVMELSPTPSEGLASMQTSPQTSSPEALSTQSNSRPMIPPSPFRPAVRSAAGIATPSDDLVTQFTNESLHGLIDLKIEDCLHTLINGGSRPSDHPLFSTFNNNSNNSNYDSSAKSSRILESEQINRDVTSPGACIALGLIYLSSNHPKILRFLELPQTVIELDSIRPDLLIYRCVSRCLIQWEYHIIPTLEWIEAEVPLAVRKVVTSSLAVTLNRDNNNPATENRPKYVGPYGKARHTHHELSAATAFSLYVNIITGYCLGIGVIYAGTFNELCKTTILAKLQWLQR